MCLVPTAYAKHYTPEHKTEFYGNVYLFNENAELIWNLMEYGNIEEGICFINIETVTLINKGEVVDTWITIPYPYSKIQIYYKGNLYWFNLKIAMIRKNFLLFTFTGG